MKIIHISDIHIGALNCNNAFEQIISTIIDQHADTRVIIISGDLCDTADNTDAFAVVKQQIDKLKNAGIQTLVAPGNHDYGSGACANKKHVAQFKQQYFDNSSIDYPKLDVIDDVAFIGLDSNEDELHWYDRFLAEGEIGKAQLNKLNNLLSTMEIANKKKVVYLHHHPIKWKFGLYLKDRKQLLSIIQNRVDALLFGHLHKGKDALIDSFCGQHGIPRIYNAGSSTHKDGDNGSVRVIHLEQDICYDYIMSI